MTPLIDELTKSHDRVIKIDVQQDQTTTQSLGVRATPTTLLIKDNVVQQVLLGARSKKKLAQLVDKIE
jgi:thioredoxin-like negative regulator of GroEL